MQVDVRSQHDRTADEASGGDDDAAASRIVTGADRGAKGRCRIGVAIRDGAESSDVKPASRKRGRGNAAEDRARFGPQSGRRLRTQAATGECNADRRGCGSFEELTPVRPI